MRSPPPYIPTGEVLPEVSRSERIRILPAQQAAGLSQLTALPETNGQSTTHGPTQLPSQLRHGGTQSGNQPPADLAQIHPVNTQITSVPSTLHQSSEVILTHEKPQVR